MIVLPLLLALQNATPPVPGACTKPASEHVGQPGCYLSGTLTIAAPPAALFWHIVPAANEAAARAGAREFRWSFVTQAHGRWWLYVLSERAEEPTLAPGHAVVGPVRIPARTPVTAHFMESLFPPGMRTRVHSHSGPEVFHVIDGEQCTATPAGEHRIRAGES